MKEATIKGKKRKSTLELLRIVAIIMIIMHHYTLYSGFLWNNEITFNRIVINFFEMFGKVGVCLFIIITGYFYDKAQFKIKKFIAIILEAFIYSVVGLTIGVITNSEKVNIMNIIKSIFPVTFGLYWFISTYILIYIFSPFLKRIIENISKKDFKIILTIGFAIWGILANIPKTETYFNEIIWLIYIYFIGAYIKKYNCSLLSNNKKRIIAVVLLVIVMNILTILIELLSVKLPILTQYIYFANNINSPLVLALTVIIFTIFNNINLKNNPIINNMASTTLGIYLIHENVFLREIIWKNIIKGGQYINSPLLIFNAIFGVLMVFITCMIIDLIFKRIIVTNFMKLISKISKIIKNMEIYIILKNKVIHLYEN